MDFRVFSNYTLSDVPWCCVNKFSTAQTRSSFPTYQEILNRPLAPDSISPKTRTRAIPPCATLLSDLVSRLPSCPACGMLKSFSSLRANTMWMPLDALGPSPTHFLAGAVKDDGVGIYALTSKYQLRVRLSCGSQGLPESSAFPRLRSLELPSVIMGEYQQLVRYDSSCGEAAIEATLTWVWFTP